MPKMTERAPSARVKFQYISEAFKRGVVRGDGSEAGWDDGKSAFGVSEVALPKRSSQRGEVGGDGKTASRRLHAPELLKPSILSTQKRCQGAFALLKR